MPKSHPARFGVMTFLVRGNFNAQLPDFWLTYFLNPWQCSSLAPVSNYQTITLFRNQFHLLDVVKIGR